MTAISILEQRILDKQNRKEKKEGCRVAQRGLFFCGLSKFNFDEKKEKEKDF